MSCTATGARPRFIVGFDPDSRATAFAVAELDADGPSYIVRRVEGGGVPKQPVAWQSVAGCGELLHELLGDRDPADLLIGVETQALGSTWVHDCAELIAWRWRLDTLATLIGVQVIHVDPGTWMRLVAPEGFKRGAPKGTAKKVYQQRANELVGPKLAKNEDRCAAIGIAWWLAAQLGLELRCS